MGGISLMAVPALRVSAPGGPLHTTDVRGNAAEQDAEGRSPARSARPGPGFIPRDAVAPRPHPRGYVNPW